MSRVGVQKVDITPPLGMDFIGYHRPAGIRSIGERIYATAFVFENESTKSVMVSIDNIGMLIEDTGTIRERIAESLQISVEQVMIVYTHTHSGPATASPKEMVQAYKAGLITSAVQAAVLADKSMQPAAAGWNVTFGDIGVNRRERTADGAAKMGTYADGVVDRRIGVLAIRNEEMENLSGLLIFCTAHPNVLMSDSDVLSADYPGLTRTMLEQALHCPVIVVQGAAGNVNAKYRGSAAALEKMAYTLSGHVLTMLPTITYEIISGLKTVSTTMQMRLKEVPGPAGIEQMAAAAEQQWGVGTDKWRAALLEMERRGIRELCIPLEIQSLQINEGSFSGIPMEPFSETALDIRDRLGNQLAFFGGYTNGYLGYLPPAEEYPYGGYEVLVNPVVYGPITGLWMPPAEQTAEQAANKVIELHMWGQHSE